MSSQTSHEIPEQIRDVMREDEIENMENLDGWATGRVALQEITANPEHDDEVLDNAWIELFNGEGLAGESAEQSAGSTVEDRRSSKFGGVRFMAVDDDGEYREAYAYPDRKSLHGNEPGWYVQKFYQPTDPDVGPRYPDGPGVSR